MAFFEILLEAGIAVARLVLFVLLPTMVSVSAIKKLLEARGILNRIADSLAPHLRHLGLSGSAAFAILEVTLISFSAPADTLSRMDQDKRVGNREIAATLSLVLAMSQGNVIFPLALVGLNLWHTIGISLLGGAIASTLTYHVFARHLAPSAASFHLPVETKMPTTAALKLGAASGCRLVWSSLKYIAPAVIVVRLLDRTGAAETLQGLLLSVFVSLEIPEAAAILAPTKALAGGSAMTGVAIDLISSGELSSAGLNRIAGFLIHPLDLVGFFFLRGAGTRVRAAAILAIPGTAIAIFVRGMIHLTI